MDTMERRSYPKVCRKYARKWYNQGMSFSIPNPVKPEHDIAIWASCGLLVVEGIYNQAEMLLEDSITAQILPKLCDLYGLRIVYNPETR